MSLYVIDANIAAKWFFEEDYSEAAVKVLHKDNKLYAPDFILMEIDNVVCKRVKSGEITSREGEEVRTAMRLMPVRKHSFQVLLDPAYEIACQTGISLYDALYIALAVFLNCPVVTADKRLFNVLKKTPLKGNVIWVEDLV